MQVRWKKAIVAVAVACAVQLGAIVWAQAQVESQIRARGLEVGRQLFQAGSLLSQLQDEEKLRGRAGGVHELLINGAEVRVHSGSVARSKAVDLSVLVERVKAHCKRPEQGPAGGPALVEAPLVEWVGGDEAFVYCLKPRRSWSLETVREALADFGQSGDFSAWGVVQGAYFRASEQSISVLTTEMKRGLSPAEMFPQAGDSPGENMAQLPAPGGRRVLSVAHQSRVALTAHEQLGTPDKVLSDYQLRLVEGGLAVRRAATPKASSLALVARSAESAYIVVAQPREAMSQLIVARLPD